MNDSNIKGPDFWKMEPVMIDGERVAARHRVFVDKKKYKIRLQDETEDNVTIAIDPILTDRDT